MLNYSCGRWEGQQLHRRTPCVRPRKLGAPSGGRGVSPLFRHRHRRAQPAVLCPHLSAAKAAHPLNTQHVPALVSTVTKGSCRRTCLELDLQQSLARKLLPHHHAWGWFCRGRGSASLLAPDLSRPRTQAFECPGIANKVLKVFVSVSISRQGASQRGL